MAGTKTDKGNIAAFGGVYGRRHSPDCEAGAGKGRGILPVPDNLQRRDALRPRGTVVADGDAITWSDLLKGSADVGDLTRGRAHSLLCIYMTDLFNSRPLGGQQHALARYMCECLGIVWSDDPVRFFDALRGMRGRYWQERHEPLEVRA